MTRYQEVERKFDAEPGLPLPDLSTITGTTGASGARGTLSEAVESQLEATYFDTIDEQLSRHHITLRRRTGGDDAGWHLKLPVGLDERTEVRLPLGHSTNEVPEALLKEIQAIVGDRPLIPIAVLQTTRTERRLLSESGTALAVVADDTVKGSRLTDGKAQVSTWREVEVELLDGDRAFLEAVSGRLLAAGLTPSGSASKLARVLGDQPAVIPTRGS